MDIKYNREKGGIVDDNNWYNVWMPGYCLDDDQLHLSSVNRPLHAMN